LNREKLWKLLRYQPIHNKSLQFHNSKTRIILLLGGMRSGKTSAMVVKVIEKLLEKPRQNIWVVALDYSLTKRFIFGKGEVKGVDTYLTNYLPFIVAKRDQKEHVLELKTKSLLQGKSTKYISSFASEKVNGLVIEDAENISNSAWHNYIYPRVMDTGGFIWVNSVPTFDINHWTYEVMDRAISGDKEVSFYNFLTEENPHCDKQFILSLKKNMPEDAVNRAIGVINRKKDENVLANVLFVGDFNPYQVGHFYKVGMDVSRFGHSRTVIAVADYTEKRICFVDYFPKKFMKRDQFYERIYSTLSAYNWCPIRVDSAGIGFGTYEELKKDGRSIVEDGGVKTLARRNKVIETVILASQRGWTFPDHPELKKEFYNLVLQLKEGEKTGEVKTFYVPKNKEIGFDGVIACGLALEDFIQVEHIVQHSGNKKNIFTPIGEKWYNTDIETGTGYIEELKQELLEEFNPNELEKTIPF